MCVCAPSCPPTSLPVPPVGAVPEHPLQGPCSASSPHWPSVLCVAMDMFHCHSLTSPYPRPLPQRPKGCSPCLCLSVLSCIQDRRYCLSKVHLCALIRCNIGVYFLIVLTCTLFTMSCQFLQSSKVIQLYMPIFFSVMVYHSIFHLVTCTIQ